MADRGLPGLPHHILFFFIAGAQGLRVLSSQQLLVASINQFSTNYTGLPAQATATQSTATTPLNTYAASQAMASTTILSGAT